MQGLLVFSFREACHPMLETRQPKTFFIGSSPFRVFTRTYTINTENILRHIFSSWVIGEDSEPLYTYLLEGACSFLGLRLPSQAGWLETSTDNLNYRSSSSYPPITLTNTHIGQYWSFTSSRIAVRLSSRFTFVEVAVAQVEFLQKEKQGHFTSPSSFLSGRRTRYQSSRRGILLWGWRYRDQSYSTCWGSQKGKERLKVLDRRAWEILVGIWWGQLRQR